jgi:hypothetical protein
MSIAGIDIRIILHGRMLRDALPSVFFSAFFSLLRPFALGF